MNELISLPHWDPNKLNYLICQSSVSNGCIHESKSTPPNIGRFNKTMRKDVSKYFNKFIFRTRLNEPLDCFFKLREEYPELAWDRFVNYKKEDYHPKYIPLRVSSFYYKIEYCVIEESLITYLETKLSSGDKNLIELKKLFLKTGNSLSFKEYIDEKTKYLISLDLTQYAEELKKPLKKESD